DPSGGESTAASSRSVSLPATVPAIFAALTCVADFGAGPVATSAATAPKRAAPPAIAKASRARGASSLLLRRSPSGAVSAGALVPMMWPCEGVRAAASAPLLDSGEGPGTDDLGEPAPST